MSDQVRDVARKSSTRRGVPHKRPRKPLSCEPCRVSKLRCDRHLPCSACRRRECESACTFRRSREAVDNNSTVLGDTSVTLASNPSACPPSPPVVATTNVAEYCHSPGPSILRNALSENPPVQSPSDGPLCSVPSWDTVLERPALGRDNDAPGLDPDPFASFAFGPKVPKSELMGLLPLNTTCEFLFSRYFTYQAPLFHVLHVPTFQQQYAEFTHSSTEASLPWLALLFVISSMAVQTLGDGDPILRECQPSGSEVDACDPQSVSRHLRKAALACLSEARFMVKYNLTTLEALLVMIYGICHSEGVDRAWVFLGVALNMGIALRCNVNHPNQNRIEQQRRTRCWAGIRLLYTYQGILFHDVDPSFLLAFPSPTPTDEYDLGINEVNTGESSTCPNSISIMKFKLRLFELSARIGSSFSSSSGFDEATMHHYEALIATEQEQWTSLFLPSGCPSFSDTSSYAYWCILETYAHQLYLLIHRPFYHSQSPKFLPSSRENYTKASIALLDIYEKMCELPILRPYRWLVNGMTSFNALQGVVALAACMIDKPGQVDSIASHRVIFDAAVQRIESLRKSSPVCERGYPAIQAIQTQISALTDDERHTPSREWDPNADWLDLTSNDWSFWENFIDDHRQGGF